MKILFVDDEPRRMRPIIEELKIAGHDVVVMNRIDEVVGLLGKGELQADLFVLDVSMPSGAVYGFEDTVGGSRTGLVLYHELRRARPESKIVVLTNVSDPKVAEEFAKEDPRRCLFLRKPDVLPFQVVEAIEKLTGNK